MTAAAVHDAEPRTEPVPAPDPAPDPARSEGRVLGVDAARGVALLGMMAVHALHVADAEGRPTWVGTVALGHAAALFAVLAGVGTAVLTGRARVRGGADTRRAAASLTARAIVIGVLGLAVGGVTDPEVATVILPSYAVLFLLAIPLVLLPTPVLVGGAVLGAAGFPVVSHLVRDRLPLPELGNPSLSWLVTDPLGLVRELFLTGSYPALSWLPYLAVGLVVGRARLRSPRLAAGLAGGGVALAAAAAGTSALLLGPGGGLARITAASSGLDPAVVAEALTIGPDGTTPTTTWWWLAVDSPHSSTPPDLARTLGTALAVLGVMLLLDRVRSPVLAVVRAPLAAAGAMTLTFYTLHVLFLDSPVDVYGPVTGYVVQVVAVLLLGIAWRASAGRGPLETLASAAGARAARWVAP
ncbi:heparan-alpha-glucosaminide N-acetyltransferase domain-containing protein [Actinomycetospora straminea]|uniref:heparan-alpha-glucosaminide N-acetyltransferase domain-containing protein n=1 Tax=Actinomycetospora straminea TaxID=663607 RepID=UPI0023658B60|nr:heparan-alpha-glucosaminide N-acetyltransferase domain-containing protein [Actinomycetospora straminea]MDD7932046.1 heparan-alpha-glucosaminide N-acetyltransferase domain-containing protein [Actinomycetospora straminea]